MSGRGDFTSIKLAVLEEIERIAGAKLDPALRHGLRFNGMTHARLIQLRDLIDDAVKRAKGQPSDRLKAEGGTFTTNDTTEWDEHG